MRNNPCTFLLAGLLSLCTIPIFADSGTPTERANLPGLPFDEQIIKWRLEKMLCPVKAAYSTEVASYIRQYLTYGLQDTERMLGDSKLYFPIFEHYLDLHGLPEQLKFLPLVESSLMPYRVSHAGAAGLWQVMPNTAGSLGLIIDKFLDERKDPYRSTEAAIYYLKKLYSRFGNWELTLAAYNCGPSRLSKIIRFHGTDDFYKIKSSLPEETQRYISRFVAACYVGTFHSLHGVFPTDPPTWHLQPLAGKVYEAVSLKNISSLTGVELTVLKEMNPSFKADYSPARQKGIFLVLPKESWNGYLVANNKAMAKAVSRP